MTAPAQPTPEGVHYHRGFGKSSNVGTFTPICGARVGKSTSNAALVTCHGCIHALSEGASLLRGVNVLLAGAALLAAVPERTRHGVRARRGKKSKAAAKRHAAKKAARKARRRNR